MAACGQASGPAASDGPLLDSRVLGVLETFLGSLLLGALAAPSVLAALVVPAGSVAAGLTLVVDLTLEKAGTLGTVGATASAERPITHV